MEDKVAEYLEPQKYNVSVKRAEAVAIFEEHRPVSLKKAKKTVKKAGFEYMGSEMVATGHMEWSGQSDESTILLKDPQADMTIRFSASDTRAVYDGLVESFRKGTIGDTVQVRGAVVESKDAVKRAKAVDAQFTLAVMDWAPGKGSRIPPLVPNKASESKPKQKKEPSDGGWF